MGRYQTRGLSFANYDGSSFAKGADGSIWGMPAQLQITHTRADLAIDSRQVRADNLPASRRCAKRHGLVHGRSEQLGEVRRDQLVAAARSKAATRTLGYSVEPSQTSHALIGAKNRGTASAQESPNQSASAATKPTDGLRSICVPPFVIVLLIARCAQIGYSKIQGRQPPTRAKENVP
jgi:hypothetical protein